MYLILTFVRFLTIGLAYCHFKLKWNVKEKENQKHASLYFNIFILAHLFISFKVQIHNRLNKEYL
jgi:hypothetical protein